MFWEIVFLPLVIFSCKLDDVEAEEDEDADRLGAEGAEDLAEGKRADNAGVRFSFQLCQCVASLRSELYANGGVICYLKSSKIAQVSWARHTSWRHPAKTVSQLM